MKEIKLMVTERLKQERTRHLLEETVRLHIELVKIDIEVEILGTKGSYAEVRRRDLSSLRTIKEKEYKATRRLYEKDLHKNKKTTT